MDVVGDKRDFNPVYEGLSDGPIKNVVKEIIKALKDDSIVGEHIRRNQIPQYYIQRHNIQILYRVALPQQWRLIYTFHTFNEGEKPKALLLELMNHDKYNKRFGYFKKASS
ncbi:hypothetical protein [Candidatus Nitrosotalea okcheonensis]|uniref:Plasmid stabilization system n=1 Tax=Candidatus Nitrosotalea okcheonensis TaxID=1903276 RepID=A0A2H1FEQ5_9ARCH|nr:hypothetical protein [Candidatus Nitrosotalea okcheonensis]MDE1831335.1 hypothetical protein [Nitrososphaerota archaeon]MDE1878881.1 hypothetical protein [Nitrososphaerota archaeon]SMH71266.1 protein of unknown function [Candidatus Nitrosotalea okcheonensis]